MFLPSIMRTNRSPICPSRKVTAEEQVHEINLAKDVDKVQDLAQEETDGIKVMIVQVGGEIIDEKFLALILGVLSDDGAIQVQYEHLHP
jgi:NADPH-dependent curcumin reductase CurA